MMRERDTILILGATSDIGRTVARAYAAERCALQMAARNSVRLVPDAKDLRIRYEVPVTVHEFDALDTDAHEAFVDQLDPLPDVVVCVVGLLGNQKKSEHDFRAADTVIRTNYIGPVSVLGALANRFEGRGSGTIIGISSVAGDRGRASNYIYGSAKAGFTAFLSGLRNRLHRSGVRVITVKPGFVDTRMTEGLEVPAALTASPEEVARSVVRADRRRIEVVYVRPVWRVIMGIICALPEGLFKRMSI